jgi:hypothetical protein
MRFNIVLSVSFLATLTVGLVIPSHDVEARNLDVREGLVDDAADYMVFKREPRTSNAKKARNAVAAQAKADKKASFQAAAKAHKATTNLPNRHSTFNVPGSAARNKPTHTYTGKDVRKAVFDGHMAAQKAKAAGQPSPHKGFKNFPNRVAQTNGGRAVNPLPHMKVDSNKPHAPGKAPGREINLPNRHNPAKPGPARVITQQTKAGHHTFKGVVAHDQSRTKGSKGYNDHFQVKAVKPH